MTRTLPILACLLLLASCDPSVHTDVKGDRDVVHVTSGKLKDGDGGSRVFFILRDKDTGVDYLAVIDAGIVRLDPRPAPHQMPEKAPQ